MPISLIQALFGLGGVCFVLCITVFHYFKDKVDKHISEEMKAFFSSQVNNSFLKMVKEGNLPSFVMKDFERELFRKGEPRRRLRSLLMFLPLDGCLFFLSASVASLGLVDNQIITSISTFLESLADSLLLVSFVVIIYCAYQLIKLGLELT